MKEIAYKMQMPSGLRTSKYPIVCYGMKFDKGEDFHDWVSGLYKKNLSAKDRLILDFTYDNGFLAHADYVCLKRKPIVG